MNVETRCNSAAPASPVSAHRGRTSKLYDVRPCPRCLIFFLAPAPSPFHPERHVSGSCRLYSALVGRIDAPAAAGLFVRPLSPGHFVPGLDHQSLESPACELRHTSGPVHDARHSLVAPVAGKV
jgi:hypothetical protein